MSHTIYLPVVPGHPAPVEPAARPAVDLPSGPCLGIPHQYDGDVRQWSRHFADADGNPCSFYDWGWTFGGDAYQRMIWQTAKGMDLHRISRIVKRDPRHLWLLFNEPERADQADLSPQAGAQFALKMAGIDMRFATPGVCIGGPGFEWADQYLDAGGPVPDAWAFHLYYAETPEEVERRLLLLRAWLDGHGFTQPVIITEINAHWTEPKKEIAVMRYIAQRCDELSWLAAWYWFSLYYDDGTEKTRHTNLIDVTGKLTSVGDAFAAIRAGWPA